MMKACLSGFRLLSGLEVFLESVSVVLSFLDVWCNSNGLRVSLFIVVNLLL